MGKKGKKTRWRRLPITGTEDDGGLSIQPSPPDSASDNQRITFNEDEYTKITTPRQDVLFKKGYFGRKRVTNPPEAQDVHSADSMESESYVNEEPQYLYTTPTGYVDPTSGIYYVNSSSYETYDPYTGTVTVVVGPAPQYHPPGTHPVLAAVQCQPVPLQPLEWYNPSASWSYSCARKKRYSTDSQNCSAQSSESTGPPGSPQESIEEGAGAVFPPQYVYAGYMFGAPLYNVNGISVQGVIPQSPPPPPSPADITASKRRKKRRRRRRGGVTDDGSESSCEEPLICDITGSQSAASSEIIETHSGASSDTGPGSGCSKTNSDSGVNTEATPNSGINSPPLQSQIQIGVIELTKICSENPPSPSIDNFTNSINQEIEHNTNDQVCTHVQANSIVNDQNSLPCIEIQDANDVLLPDENVECGDGFCIQSKNVSEINQQFPSSSDFTVHVNTSVQEDISSNILIPSASEDSIPANAIENSCVILQEENCASKSTKSNIVPYNGTDFNINGVVEKSEKSSQDIIELRITPNGPLHWKEDVTEEKVMTKEELQLDDKNNKTIEVKDTCVKLENEHLPNEELNNLSLKGDKFIMEDMLLSNLVDPLRFDEMSMTVTPEQPFSKFSSCRDITLPVPPPRRKRSLCRVAEKVATRLVEEAIAIGVKEAACSKCKQLLPITEAVTRWLQSQGNSVLSSTDTGYYEDESEDYVDDSHDEDEDDDEGIEDEGEELTDQKNVQGNPFLVSSLSGTRTRVADDCGSTESNTGDWNMWDHTQVMCDPTRSVDKYYRLGAEEAGVSEKKPPSVIKTAVHIRHAGPFPCGVCCIIQ